MFHAELLLLLVIGWPELGTGTSIKMDFLSSGTVRRTDNDHDHLSHLYHNNMIINSDDNC